MERDRLATVTVGAHGTGMDKVMVVRLQDVAIRAGVSVKTVSNVVNGYVHVAPTTRARVEAAVAELGYRPNLSARHLRGGRSGVIAFAVPEIGVPYFAELAQQIVTEADNRGLTVLIDQTEGRADRERQVLEGIRAQLIDGVIFSPLALGRRELSARTDSTPMVMLGERSTGGLIDHVVIDNIGAASDAVAHLAALGRRRVAALGAQQDANMETAHQRLSGYRAGLKQAGLPFDAGLVAHVSAFQRRDGAFAMARLLDGATVPDAVFAFNDLLALGALRACHDRGVRVPEEIAVVGFDDIDDGRYSIPTLSTISPDKEHIARLAVELLVSRLSGGTGATRESQECVARHQLIARESTVGRSASVPLWAR